MKKIFTLTVLFLSLGFFSNAQYVTIPDDGFKAFLLTQYPGCFNAGGDLDTTCVDITTEDSLTFIGMFGINNYGALAYFDALTYLDCSNHRIEIPSNMPAQLPSTLLTLIAISINVASTPEFLISRMPAGLRHINYSRNHYNSFVGRVWPAGLKYINISGNAFSDDAGALPAGLDTLICSKQDVEYSLGGGSSLYWFLTPLPPSLKYFDCSENHLSQLPALPSSLTYLDCSHQFFFMGLSMGTPVPLLESLPTLPSALVTLKCGSNRLTGLSLPATLEHLDCSGQRYYSVLQGVPYDYPGIANLFSLPAGLKYLSCGTNALSSLPPLPPSLEYLSAGANTISTVPSLPSTLQYLDLSSNPISGVGTLPPVLNYLNVSNTTVSCLSQLPATMTGQSPYNTTQYNIQAVNTNLNCIPNYIPGIRINTTSVLPLCNASNNTNGCAINPIIGGLIFYDNNSNGVQDPGEVPRANVRVELNGSAYAFSDINGHYELTAPVGNNILTVQSPPFYNPVPASFTHTVSSPSTFINDTVALQPTVFFYSVKITIIASPNPRQNLPLTYLIQYENIGTANISPAITVTYDNNNLTYINSTNGGVIQSGNTLTLSAGVLQPGQVGSFTSTFTVNISASIGTTITGIANVVAGSNSATDSALSVVVGAIDPNDKQATPSLTQEQLNQGTYINYIIRFQNVGTASALNIFIADTLSTMLQVNTLEMIAASHTCRISLRGNNLLFEFLDINLPDSTSNEPGSHGFIRFRIKPLTTLSPNTIVLNKASIYFDYNSAVVTNTAPTLIALAPVPVTLLDFTGMSRPANKVLLQWKTANENSTSRFEIEQSLHGNKFDSVATERAVGSGNNSYSKTLVLPAATAYYRLKIIDIDGREIYSHVIKISGGKNQSGLTLGNNPARNELNISVTDNSLLNTKLWIINSQGLAVKTFVLTTALQHINIVDLAAGVYYLRTQNGSEKIVISR